MWLACLLVKPRTFAEIVGAWIFYGKPREPKFLREFGERLHMKKHLEKLMNEEVVEMDGDRYFKK